MRRWLIGERFDSFKVCQEERILAFEESDRDPLCFKRRHCIPGDASPPRVVSSRCESDKHISAKKCRAHLRQQRPVLAHPPLTPRPHLSRICRAAEQKQKHERHLSPLSLHAAASWGASEVALPERSPAAAACNLLRPQTSTAFKDSQPRPVARVVALPPLLSPPPPPPLAQCSVLISTTLLWRGTGVQRNLCPPHQKHRFPLVPPPPPPQHLPPPDSSRRAALTAIQSRTLSLCLSRCAEQTRETPNKAGPISATTTTTPVSSLCSASAHAHGRDSSVPGLLSSFAATPSGLGPPNWSPRPPPSFCDSECDGICRFTLGV